MLGLFEPEPQSVDGETSENVTGAELIRGREYRVHYADVRAASVKVTDSDEAHGTVKLEIDDA